MSSRAPSIGISLLSQSTASSVLSQTSALIAITYNVTEISLVRPTALVSISPLLGRLRKLASANTVSQENTSYLCQETAFSFYRP